MHLLCIRLFQQCNSHSNENKVNELVTSPNSDHCAKYSLINVAVANVRVFHTENLVATFFVI